MPTVSWNKLVVFGPPTPVRQFRAAVRIAAPTRCATPLSLDRLRPRDDAERALVARHAGNGDWDPKGDAWDVEVGPLRIRVGIGTLVYSFMTAWCEPIGPVACVSIRFPQLCFLLAGVEVSNGDFTSSLIRNGRCRHWRMPHTLIATVGEFEPCAGAEGPSFAAYQPRIMDALIRHWDSYVDRFARRPARKGSH